MFSFRMMLSTFTACLVAAFVLGAQMPAGVAAGDRAAVQALPAHKDGASVAASPQGVPPSTVLSLDDGTFESAIGVVNNAFTIGSQAVYLNRFTINPEQLPFTLDSVSFLIPASTEVGSTDIIPGSQFEMLVYEDPNGTGDPNQTTLTVTKSFAVAPSNSVFHTVLLDLPIVIQSGDIWVGFTNTVTRTDSLPIFPGALDTTGTNQGRSYVFFNDTAGEHFSGPLQNAEIGTVIGGNWLIRASGQPGGFTCVTWEPPASTRGDAGPPPLNAHVCDDVPPPRAEGLQEPRDVLMGYNVYRSSQPGVTTTPGNLFSSVPPSQTQVGSSVGSSGSFFVVTAVYDTGESGPSNELSIIPATITSHKVKKAKITVNGANFTDMVSVFIDGIPFLQPAKVKKANTRVVQQGALITGQTLAQYFAQNGNSARITVRNSTGTFVNVDVTGP